MLTITRRRTVDDLEAAIFALRDLVDQYVPEAVANDCPAFGCCGCGAWMADTRTPPSEGYPRGEGYCWRCVDKLGIGDKVVVLRERTP